MAASTSEHPLMRLPLGQHMGVVQPSQTYTCPGYPSWVENVPQNRGRHCKFTLFGPASMYCLYCRRRLGLSSIVIMSYFLPRSAEGGRIAVPLEHVDPDVAAAVLAAIRAGRREAEVLQEMPDGWEEMGPE